MSEIQNPPEPDLTENPAQNTLSEKPESEKIVTGLEEALAEEQDAEKEANQ
jgi:hypothetical protein